MKRRAIACLYAWATRGRDMATKEQHKQIVVTTAAIDEAETIAIMEGIV